MRQAMKYAGGHNHLVVKAGVKSRTLNNLLNGQEMRQTVLVALADACGVSVEWLATGRGKMHVGAIEPKSPPSADRDLQPLADAQKVALKAALLLVWNILGATKQPQTPLDLWIKWLEYYDAMLGVGIKESARFGRIYTLAEEELLRHKSEE